MTYKRKGDGNRKSPFHTCIKQSLELEIVIWRCDTFVKRFRKKIHNLFDKKRNSQLVVVVLDGGCV